MSSNVSRREFYSVVSSIFLCMAVVLGASESNNSGFRTLVLFFLFGMQVFSLVASLRSATPQDNLSDKET